MRADREKLGVIERISREFIGLLELKGRGRVLEMREIK
jgi:hypothetical protein